VKHATIAMSVFSLNSVAEALPHFGPKGQPEHDHRWSELFTFPTSKAGRIQQVWNTTVGPFYARFMPEEPELHSRPVLVTALARALQKQVEKAAKEDTERLAWFRAKVRELTEDVDHLTPQAGRARRKKVVGRHKARNDELIDDIIDSIDEQLNLRVVRNLDPEAAVQELVYRRQNRVADWCKQNADARGVPAMVHCVYAAADADGLSVETHEAFHNLSCQPRWFSHPKEIRFRCIMAVSPDRTLFIDLRFSNSKATLDRLFKHLRTKYGVVHVELAAGAVRVNSETYAPDSIKLLDLAQPCYIVFRTPAAAAPQGATESTDSAAQPESEPTESDAGAASPGPASASARALPLQNPLGDDEFRRLLVNPPPLLSTEELIGDGWLDYSDFKDYL